MKPAIEPAPSADALAASPWPQPQAVAVPTVSPLRVRSVRRPRRRRPSVSQALIVASFTVIAGFVLCALVPERLAPYAPTEMHADAILEAPSATHPFGTDQFGRDVFSLVIYGARQSLLIGVSAVAISCSIGVGLGLLAGYAGGFLDTAIMRLIDIWMAVPGILLAISLSTALGPSLPTTILAVSVSAIPRYARVLRSQALAVRGRTFILAARAAGASHASILLRHVLPHCLAPTLVMATLGVGGAILTGSGLSFLGLGINDERPDWGYLLTQGRGYLTVAWWTVTFPGLSITSLVISVNLLGGALRRRIDPRRAAH